MYYLFLALLPVALGQIRADVNFGAENDRYDLTPLIHQGNYDQWDNVVGVRRNYGMINPVGESNGPADVTKHFLNTVRRFREDFDQNLVQKDTARKNYEDQAISSDVRNDRVNYLHENQMRRNGDTPDDRTLLMHYGVPIVMKVQGIMQVPLSRK